MSFFRKVHIQHDYQNLENLRQVVFPQVEPENKHLFKSAIYALKPT